MVERFFVAVALVALGAGCGENCEDIAQSSAISAVLKDADSGETICAGNVYAQRSSDGRQFPFQAGGLDPGSCKFSANGTGSSPGHYTVVANASGYKTTVVRDVETEEGDSCRIKGKTITIELVRD